MMACTLRTDARSNNSEYNDLRTNEPLDNHMYAITSKTETCVTVAMNHTMGTTSLEVPVTTLTDMFNTLYVMSPYITQVSWKHHQFQGTYQGKRGWINNPMIFLEVKDSLELNVVLEGSQTTEVIVLAHDFKSWEEPLRPRVLPTLTASIVEEDVKEKESVVDIYMQTSVSYSAGTWIPNTTLPSGRYCLVFQSPIDPAGIHPFLIKLWFKEKARNSDFKVKWTQVDEVPNNVLSEVLPSSSAKVSREKIATYHESIACLYETIESLQHTVQLLQQRKVLLEQRLAN